MIRSLQSNLWPTESQKERMSEQLDGARNYRSDVPPAETISANSNSSTYPNDAYDEEINGTDGRATEAIKFPFDHLYREISENNQNQNNANVESSAAAAWMATGALGHATEDVPSTSFYQGAMNQAYVEDWRNTSQDVDSISLTKESETGEISVKPPDSRQMGQIWGLVSPHVNLETASDEGSFTPKQVCDFSVSEFDYADNRHLTPVEDNSSLTSNSSSQLPLFNHQLPSEVPEATTIYVSSPTISDRQNALLSQQLPNMAEGGPQTVLFEPSLKDMNAPVV